MANTIDVEAKKAINLVTDVDRFRRKSKIREGDFTITLVNPLITTYEKFRFFLLKNSKSVELDRRYLQRPDYLSFDEYGTTILWPLLLFMNNVATLEEFTESPVVVPFLDVVLDIARHNEQSFPVIDIDKLNQPPTNADKIVLYTSKFGPKLDEA